MPRPRLRPPAPAQLGRSRPLRGSQRLALLAWLLTLAWMVAFARADEPGPADPEATALQLMVQADWALQERRLGRSPQSPAAIRQALRRANLLLADLRGVGRDR